MIYLLSLRDEGRDVGGPVLPGRLEQWPGGTPALFGRAARDALAIEPRVTFLLHGYNVSLSEGRASLLRFAGLLAGVSGGLVATVWPGDSRLGGLGYPFEGTQADDAGRELARFVEDALVPGTPVSLVSHSLGGRVLLGAVERLAEVGFPVDQVCLMAPAVDDFALADPGEYRAGVAASGRVAVLHSRADRVLRLLYPAGDWLEAFVFFWRDEMGFALGYGGPRPAGDVAVPETVLHQALGAHDVDHGDYLPSSDPGRPVAGPERSAAAYTEQVLTQARDPVYPAP